VKSQDSILITGGGGMLGHALADIFAARGQPAVSLPRAKLDVANQSALQSAFEQYKPKLVFNCAAHTKVDLCEQEIERADAVNGYAVGVLASLCRDSAARLVHISTDFVFDGTSNRPYRSDDPVNPLGAYGSSKLLGETELQRNAPVQWLIVRTAWVYGRWGANFPRAMVQAARAGKPLTVVKDQIGSPTYAPDLAEAIIRLVQSGAQGIWHVTNSGQTSWFDLAAATLEQFGITADLTAISSAQWARIRPGSAARPAYSVLDISALTQQIGRPMRPWREAVGDFHRAVQAHGF
jgi:dTDP-4-dehydrorhamnose reductase